MLSVTAADIRLFQIVSALLVARRAGTAVRVVEWALEWACRVGLQETALLLIVAVVLPRRIAVL